jgi:group II intron reverse transcriptase/maturase
VKRAYEQVKRNGGAAGVDGMSGEAYAAHAARHWSGIEAKLRDGHYQPGAVRAVSIPKAQGGERRLGIPNVQDRVIQQALLPVLGPLLDPAFSPHSYGYRPGRSAHDAIHAARAYVEEGKTWVIDLDISAFFDEVNHDRLMARLGRTVRDPQVLRLIGAYLRAPIRSAGRDEKRSQGTPQGSPLSPLLANLYLDALDQELAQRGVSFCRYADDVAIFVRSQRSGERILASLTVWIATHLYLRVNASKSGVDRPWNGQFLGVRITEDGQIAPAPRSVERRKETLATVHPGLVELLPRVRPAARHNPAGRLDAAPHAEILLATLAQPQGTAERAATTESPAVPSAPSERVCRRMAQGPQPDAANRPEQRPTQALGSLCAI